MINVNHHHYAEKENPEGKVNIDPTTIKNPNHDDKHLGEYVDYEEVK